MGSLAFPLGSACLQIALPAAFSGRVAGAGWRCLHIALSFAGTLWPNYQGTVFTVSQPAFFGEMAFMLWLVIKGANPQTARAPAPAGPIPLTP